MDGITSAPPSPVKKDWAEELKGDAKAQGFIRDLEQKVPSLATTDAELTELMRKAFFGEKASDATREYFNALHQKRMRLVTAFSNFIRTTHEMIMVMIRNMNLRA